MKTLKYINFNNESELLDFVNNNSNIEVVSICPIEGGKSWINYYKLFYYEFN